MKRVGLLWFLFVVAGCLAVSPLAQAGPGCNSSQTAAVQCFVRNAVQTGLLTVPPGMTLSQFASFGVSVSQTVQSPAAIVFLLGSSAAVTDAMPGTNSDGTPNAAAESAALNALVNAALNDGIIQLPPGVQASQLLMLAQNLCAAMAQNAGVNLSSGTVLRLLDSLVVAATSNGVVDWSKVQAAISPIVDALLTSKLLMLPTGITADAVKQFALDVAHAIQNYKAATGRTTL